MSPCVTVLQSCPANECDGWLARCMESVHSWAKQRGYAYRWLDDALFGLLPEDLQPGGLLTPVIASDIARLLWMQQMLAEGAHSVLWLDADVLIFNPEAFVLPDTSYAVGREVWVQQGEGRRWRVHRKVHNAALYAADMGDGHNSFVDFYADTAQRLVRANRRGMPAQFVGPKLLTALHNTVQFPVLETAGMLSPPVVADVLVGGGEALERMRSKSTASLYAANLCRSSVAGQQLDARQMDQLVSTLIRHPQLLAVA